MQRCLNSPTLHSFINIRDSKKTPKNWGTLILGTNGEASLSPGWHRIAGVCWLNDGTWIQGGSKQTYFEIKIGADNMPDSLVLHPIVITEITKFECISGKVVGTRQKVRITINNEGDDTNSMLYFYAGQSDCRETPLTRIPLLLHRGETATFDVAFFAENTGTYYLNLATTDDGIDYVAKTEVDIIPAPQSPARLELTECTIAPDCQSAQVTVNNRSDEPYHREIVAQLYEEVYNDGNYYYIRSIDQQGAIAPHSTKTLNFRLEGIKAHRNYYLYIGHYLLHTDEFTTQLGTSQYFNSSTTDIAPIKSEASKPAQNSLYRIDGKRANTTALKGINGKKVMMK